MPPPPEPTELERQVRKLRLEVRRLRWTVIFCTCTICLALGLGFTAGFGWVLGAFGILAGVVAVLVCIASSARLLADGWDTVSMRWQRARWQAERNKPDEPS